MKTTPKPHGNGLLHDLPRLLQTGWSRRRWMQLAGATGVNILVPGCSSWGAPPKTSTNASGDSCIEAAAETAGPYPSDGSNSRGGSVMNTLAEAGVVRRDITPSFGASSRTAEGIILDFSMKLVDVNDHCAPLTDYAVYSWHCDAGGLYSLYSDGVLDDNYLRGVQISDANGELSFRTVIPGCYRGRFPHIHFEVFRRLEDIADYKNRILTSQMAIPRDICAAAYAADDSYTNSIDNFSRMTLANDGVFKNNSPEQIEAMTIQIEGLPATGFTGSLTIGVAT